VAQNSSVRSVAIRATVALILIVLVSAYPASGFSCAQRDPRDLARGAQVIVAGVIEAESVLGMRVRVQRVYQGSAEGTITVLPGQGNANRVGTPWTFYLRRNAVAYDHSDCGGSHPQTLTPEEISAFGGGHPPTVDQQLFGQIGNTVAGLGVLLALLLLARRSRRPPMTPAGAHP
jgi:hypothetical protein